MTALLIPSPPISGLSFGDLRFRFYPLVVVIGVAVTWVLSQRRWKGRGGEAAQLELVVMWTAPLALVGGRLYYVVSHWADFFGPGGDPLSVLYVWQGGSSFFGALLFGTIALYFVGREASVRFSSTADALAPAVAAGLGIGRLGNWFSQEMFGAPTDSAIGIAIDPARRPVGAELFVAFEPLFLFEATFDFLLAGLLVWFDRKLNLGRGKVFALFLTVYGFGRLTIEMLRVDATPELFGIRIDAIAALLAFAGGLLTFLFLQLLRPGREASVWLMADGPQGPTLEELVRANLQTFNTFRPKYLYGDLESRHSAPTSEPAEPQAEPQAETHPESKSQAEPEVEPEVEVEVETTVEGGAESGPEESAPGGQPIDTAERPKSTKPKATAAD